MGIRLLLRCSMRVLAIVQCQTQDVSNTDWTDQVNCTIILGAVALKIRNDLPPHRPIYSRRAIFGESPLGSHSSLAR